VSMPPLAIDATRCSTSSGMWAAFAAWMNASDIAASAMLNPPDADPVIPANVVTVIASLTSGFGIARNPSATTRNPGSDAITPPNPYSDAVFIDASKDPATEALVPSAKLVITVLNANTITERMPTSSAPSTAQIAARGVTCTVIGWPGNGTVKALPNTVGINPVNTLFSTPTRMSGRIATTGL